MPRNARIWVTIALILLAGSIPVTVYRMQGGSLEADTASLPSRDLSLIEQRAQAFAGLVVKPIYMMLSLLIVLALIGQRRLPIMALQWGQIGFLAGEIFCAINFYIFRHESILSEYLHSYGMALAFGFTSFAALEGWGMRFGSRINPGLRGEAKAVIQFLLPMFAILTFIPMLSPLQPDGYTVSIFNFPYSYTRLEFYQTYERRILPLIALLAFIVAFLGSLNKDASISFFVKVCLSVGLGALGFSLFRLALNAIFASGLIWFEFWEEATELMFVGFIAFIVWRYKTVLLDQTPMIELFPARGK